MSTAFIGLPVLLGGSLVLQKGSIFRLAGEAGVHVGDDPGLAESPDIPGLGGLRELSIDVIMVVGVEYPVGHVDDPTHFLNILPADHRDGGAVDIALGLLHAHDHQVRPIEHR